MKNKSTDYVFIEKQSKMDSLLDTSYSLLFDAKKEALLIPKISLLLFSMNVQKCGWQ